MDVSFDGSGGGGDMGVPCTCGGCFNIVVVVVVLIEGGGD
tara:strand:+ start:745 stop:864 length:120 start_codon:yes stop_codon:yes gene_type:complete